METKDWILSIGSGVAFLVFARDWWFKSVELRRSRQSDSETKSGKETEKEASVRVRQYETEDRDKDRLEKIATDAQNEVKELQRETKQLTREVADLSAKLTVNTERYEDLKKDFVEMAAELRGIREENIRLQAVEMRCSELKTENAALVAKLEKADIMCIAALKAQEKTEGANSQLQRRVEDLTLKLTAIDPNYQQHHDDAEAMQSPFLASVTVEPAAVVVPVLPVVLPVVVPPDMPEPL